MIAQAQIPTYGDTAERESKFFLTIFAAGTPTFLYRQTRICPLTTTTIQK